MDQDLTTKVTAPDQVVHETIHSNSVPGVGE